MNPVFKKLDLKGLSNLVAWARDEGWNPGPFDANAFFATDPEGHYGLFLGDEMIGGGSLVSYNGDFGFMGLFIVHPDYRTAGIGRKLWYQRRDLLISRLKPNASIGMDGVLAMQEFYAKGGFKIAFRDERYQKKGMSFAQHAEVSLYSADDFADLMQLDKKCFGFDRTAFMLNWLEIPGTKVFIHKETTDLLGYAVLRKADSGYKIGPLFALNSNAAEQLYETCLSCVPDQMVYLDIPVTNKSAVNLVRKYQAAYVFECARMYYGNAPDIDMDMVYGITSFELG